MIILPTLEPIDDLIFALKDVENANVNYDKLFKILLGVLSFENLALEKLESAKEEYKRTFDSIDPAQSEKISHEVYRAGLSLYSFLKEINAYQNGYLIYVPQSWCGKNLVLRKLDPEEIPEVT